MGGRTRLGKRFTRDQRGVAAVEFALVAPMLFALIFASIEAGWVMVQTIMLDRALDRTVRSLRVGDIANPTQESVRSALCGDAMVLVNCSEALTLELVPARSASDYPVDSARCVNRKTGISPVLRFDTGSRTQSEFVFVRACFVVTPMTPGLGLGLALPKDETGAMRIIAKSGFLNEPS